MLIVLLTIVLPVRAEWVEIAQNSYRRTSFNKVPVTTEFTPESYNIYPNASLGGPDWRRGYVNRLGDVKRIPGASQRRPAPAQDAGAGAVNKQEYYDIDGPDEVNIHEEVASHDQEHTEVPVRLNNLDYEYGVPVNSEGNKWEDMRRPPLEKEQTGSVKQIRNKKPQDARIVDKQSKYQKGQRVNLNQEVIGEERLNLHQIMHHVVETLKKPDEEHFNKNITKHVELDIKNTSTQTVSCEKLNQETDSEEQTDIPEIALDKNKHFSGILMMFKTVANIISKNTQKSVNSKIKYLEDLKNKLLYNIQERIDSVWPGAGRAARGAEARGHVELPSSEGALMTISFLTFAVFLIKLVLQIIHTYKNKTMMMTPAVITAVGRAAAAAGRVAAAALAKN